NSCKGHSRKTPRTDFRKLDDTLPGPPKRPLARQFARHVGHPRRRLRAYGFYGIHPRVGPDSSVNMRGSSLTVTRRRRTTLEHGR
ncbi:hypothetical protein CH063_08458, partial [Colletotrichum higginsianum]